MRYQIRLLGILASVLVFSSTTLQAEIRPEKIHSVGNKKNKVYVKDGLYVGGNGKLNEFTVKDIRWGNKAEFERIVIELVGEQSPYYHVSMSPEESSITLSISGKAKLDFSPAKIIGAFKRSSMIEDIMLLPPIEGVPWTFKLVLKAGSPVEVFELNQPSSTRLILDLQHKKHKAPLKG
jgi:hypothetical protein